MSEPTSTILVRGASVPVKMHKYSSMRDLPLSPFVNSDLLQNWAANVEPGLDIQEILLSDFTYFGKRIGFLKIEVVVKYQGTLVPGVCFLRGDSVCILTVLHNVDDGVDYTILTNQPRVPVGAAGLLELPAGMLDNGKFLGVAAKEFKEEVGIELKESDLIDLQAKVNEISGVPPSRGIVPSGGGCDEKIRPFLHKRNVTTAELDAMRGKATGLRKEGEIIVLGIERLDQVWLKSSDAKLLSSLTLYTNLHALGLV
jgi:ADP-sugar diphosphatase